MINFPTYCLEKGKDIPMTYIHTYTHANKEKTAILAVNFGDYTSNLHFPAIRFNKEHILMLKRKETRL